MNILQKIGKLVVGHNISCYCVLLRPNIPILICISSSCVAILVASHLGSLYVRQSSSSINCSVYYHSYLILQFFSTSPQCLMMCSIQVDLSFLTVLRKLGFERRISFLWHEPPTRTSTFLGSTRVQAPLTFSSLPPPRQSPRLTPIE